MTITVASSCIRRLCRPGGIDCSCSREMPNLECGGRASLEPVVSAIFQAHFLACMASCLGSGLTTNFPPANQPTNQPTKGTWIFLLVHDPRSRSRGREKQLAGKKCPGTLHSKKGKKVTRKLTWRQRARGSHRQRPVPGSPPSSSPC